MSKHIVKVTCPECGCGNAKWSPTKNEARCTKCKTIVPYVSGK